MQYNIAYQYLLDSVLKKVHYIYIILKHLLWMVMEKKLGNKEI